MQVDVLLHHRARRRTGIKAAVARVQDDDRALFEVGVAGNGKGREVAEGDDQGQQDRDSQQEIGGLTPFCDKQHIFHLSVNVCCFDRGYVSSFSPLPRQQKKALNQRIQGFL